MAEGAPSTVLVTGAHGFLGRYGARAAAQAGARVVGIGHGGWDEAEWRGWGLDRWVAADVTLDSLIALGERPDTILHCAGGGSVAYSLEDPRGDFLRTVASTADLLDYARHHAPGAAIVYPSSGSVYGAAETMPFRVAMPLRPVSPYGLHKRMAEDLMVCHAANFGLRTAVVRYFSIYGPGLRKQLLWDACNRLAAGDAEFGGTGGESRDWLHVEDAARLLLAAAGAASPAAPVANGGTGESVAVERVVGLVAARLGRGTSPRFSGVVRPGDPPHTRADIAEARGWGWAPSVSLEAGIAGYVDWFAAEGGACG